MELSLLEKITAYGIATLGFAGALTITVGNYLLQKYDLSKGTKRQLNKERHNRAEDYRN